MRQRRIIVSSLGSDPAVQFVGTSPTRGDFNYTGLLLPPEPTPDQAHRVLVQLCALQVPHNKVAVVRSIRQLLTLGWIRDIAEGQTYPFEIPVPWPLFRFTDGNVSWHLRSRGPGVSAVRPSPGQPRSWSRTFEVITPNIMYDVLPPSQGGPGYVPANGGTPLGNSVANLGTFHDIRYPWRLPAGTWPSLDYRLEGPCTLALFASVFQTDPETRIDPLPEVPPPASTTDILAAIVTDGIQMARYWRIGGELVVDIEE